MNTTVKRSVSAQAEPARTERAQRRFFPDLLAVEALVALAMLAALIAVAALTKAPLGDAVGPVARTAPRPEWYFLWLFELLRFFKGGLEPVGTFVVPLLLVAGLASLPFIDRRAARTRVLVRGGRPIRLLPRVVGALAIAALLTLTIAAASQPSTPIPNPLPTPTWPPASAK